MFYVSVKVSVMHTTWPVCRTLLGLTGCSGLLTAGPVQHLLKQQVGLVSRIFSVLV